MATNYPTSLDALTNPTSSDSMSSPSHSGQHADSNDAIEALQAKVGVDSSAVATSLDYRVAQLESGGGSMTTSATAPSSPSDGDMWYDTSTGRTYVYDDDVSSQQWVEFGAAPDAGIMHVSSGAPSSPNAGDMWYDTDDGTTSLYYDDGSSQQWVQFGAAPVTTGKILQVVTDFETGSFTTTSQTMVDTDAAVTITPTSATSKVFVTYSINSVYNTTTGAQVYLVIDRDGTDLTGNARWQSSITNGRGVISFSYLDSPASTSALTYTLQMSVSSATGTIEANGYGITVMEVAA